MKNFKIIIFVILISLNINLCFTAFADYKKDIGTIIYFNDKNIFISQNKLSNNQVNQVLYLLKLGCDITVQNISNIKNTRNNKKREPYLRNYIYVYGLYDFKIKNEVIIKYIYQPLHPDAILSGNRKGYVAYPGYSIDNEKSNLKQLIKYYIYYANIIGIKESEVENFENKYKPYL